MAHILSLAEIEEVSDITEKEVPIEEWGGSVIVRSISYRGMRDITKAVANGEDEEDIDSDELQKWILIKGMVEPQIDEAAYERLIDKSSSAVMKILTAITGSTKLGEAAVVEAEKKFPAETVGDVPVQPSGESGEDSSRVVDGTFGAVGAQ